MVLVATSCVAASAQAVIVENMPGAAGLVAANSIYRAGRPDGLTIVNFQGTQVMSQILGRDGVEFDARTPQGPVHVRSHLVGRPNVYNILAAIGVTAALGIPLDAIERGLEQLEGVPGRFERVSSADDDITVFKSLGMAVEDVVAADLVFRRAIEEGAGTELTL